MNYVKMLSIALAFAASVAYADEAVEFVRICGGGSEFSFVGATIPGTDICLNLSTGVQEQTTANGVVSSQSILLQRISALERELALLEKQFGLSETE